MKGIVAAALTLAALAAHGQDQEIQRAVIQRDQQSAEFAARARGEDTRRLEQLHSEQLRDAVRPLSPLSPDPAVARQLQGYERQRMADDRVLALPPPVIQSRPAPEREPRPLTVPGGTRPLVDPIPEQGSGH